MTARFVFALIAMILVCPPALPNGGTAVQATVDWGRVMSSPNRVNNESIAKIHPAETFRSLIGTPTSVPILLPPATELVPYGANIDAIINTDSITINKVLVKQNYYVATGFVDNERVSFYIVGTSAVLVSKGSLSEFSDSVAPDSAIEVTQSRDGYHARFSKYGAAYEVSLYCRDEADDRCRMPDYVEKLVRSLLVIGEQQ